VEHATRLLNKYVVPTLSAISENTYMSAIRAGMVSIVPLTIIGGLFIIIAELPVKGWDAIVGPYADLLQIPVKASFGLLSVFVCIAIAYDLGQRLKQEAVVSAMMAVAIFLMLQINLHPSFLVELGAADIAKLSESQLTTLNDEGSVALSPRELSELGSRPLNRADFTMAMDNLGSAGLFTAILIALIVVRVQKLFTDANLVIKLP
jgi:PTS system cellobiose-specific IIC component